jgi:hypothetical protein
MPLAGPGERLPAPSRVKDCHRLAELFADSYVEA